ncbi:bifunctional 4-hydroxy-2-oxoglutarate aldolase/2-dehydro-3-deoxy-phosphogluconate aldolase [Hymenobacter sp. BT770]|uniref:bifunctional 4-hydroxy-2-oxoglutarate aldolase/2-dehydro-3-deoxy-phosphogluconate aldolase n=1 Tax=Hymenobacter sp. BT770 TaxID=2886942 RepID=UPI001D12191F|nr:bifunctional 4-hydroxy-2-oxoglutarate aldolase/2-dehydro-3-deoxy-phosphogluconate aldolase [Hymenobacter sp. BT770]MCC3151703.1 bifunctional 4-hydroxy-2-oxoglutarate aldolase/2-dehydro-3-deoxy-phosphogluconate aldolase [Hymenobacter sp. BT770]MDO3413719.1 bifunctional 4-hydroxy-2-oxoglutarate aldolase/2-dehydro-3-deoxy-phosphogluconate aldolase [Hymenobacter sp. BT770]
MTPLSHILEHKLVAIIRGANPPDLLKIAEALHEGGVRTMEITLNSPGALASIEELAEAMDGRMLIGAGTVLDPETARGALLAGARFIISPTLSKKTIRMTKRYGAVSIPGAFTTTEILKAYEHGGDIIKVFPASVGAKYFKDLAGPVPFIPLMPTGGVSLDNIKDFQDVGAVAYGLGSSLVDTSQPVSAKYLQQLTAKARRFVQAVA